MKAQIIDNKIVSVGIFNSPEFMELPETLPENFVNEIHLYTPTITDGVITELIKTGTMPDVRITEVAHNWRTEFTDYKQARERIKQMVTELGGFEALTQVEKITAAKWFAVGVAAMDSVLSVEEKIAAGIIFNEESINARARRFECIKTVFNSVLSGPDTLKVMQPILANNFEYMYVKMGFEGTGSINYKGAQDPPGILDFVLSTPGTTFATTGLDSLQLSPLYGFSVAQLKQRTVDIIKHGIY